MSNVTTQSIAVSILTAATKDFPRQVRIEEVDQQRGAAYLGGVIYNVPFDDRVVHLYMCDDDQDNPVWMTDFMDLEIGEPTSKAFTAESLNEALQFLIPEKA